MSINRIELLENYITEDPGEPFNHYALGLEFVKSERMVDARRKFQFLLDNHPEYLPTYYQFGKFLESQGENQTAIQVYQRGILVARKQNELKTASELQGALDWLQ